MQLHPRLVDDEICTETMKVKHNADALTVKFVWRRNRWVKLVWLNNEFLPEVTELRTKKEAEKAMKETLYEFELTGNII